MGRRIVSIETQAKGAAAKPVDTYFDRVIKYIPADIVSAWVFVTAATNAASDDVPKATILWIAFVCGLVLTALWTLKQTSEPGKPPAVAQTVISTAAFGVWVFALGGPFTALPFYKPLYGALLLVLFTLVVGLIVPNDDSKKPKAKGDSTAKANPPPKSV
jgi:hypothetical protein